jgi:hypothetical protein
VRLRRRSARAPTLPAQFDQVTAIQKTALLRSMAKLPSLTLTGKNIRTSSHYTACVPVLPGNRKKGVRRVYVGKWCRCEVGHGHGCGSCTYHPLISWAASRDPCAAACS